MRFRSVSIAFVIIICALASLALFGNNIFSASSNSPPVASFAYAPDIPTPSEDIIFNASLSYDPDGAVVRYAWNFGDGNVTIMTIATVSHAYPVDGNYTVELAVTDNGGATGVASAVVEVSTEVYFRVVYYGTLIPLSNVQTTMYYKQGGSWVAAPVGSSNLEIRYDNMTEPDLADTYAERFRNPGFTASILRKNASNIGFDIHPSCWEVYFKFQWGSFVAYWPNETTKVYTYNHGIVETKYYSYDHRAYWDATAGRYVIEAKEIPGSGVSPTQYHPIIVGVFCPPPPTKYYLTVRTSPTGIATIPGEGLYSNGTSVPLTAPSYVDVSSNTRYRFTYWDVDGNSQGNGVNPVSVLMTANHTATAHYVTQHLVTFNHAGLTSDATGIIVSVDGSNKVYTDLPFSKWVDTGTSVAYSYSPTVSSSVTDKRFRLTGVTGSSSPFVVSAPVNITGSYIQQFSVSFAQTGLDSTATETVVTVNGSARLYADLPYSFWADYGSSVTYSFSSTVSSSVADQRFMLIAIHSPPSPFTVTAPLTITGEYCKQYRVTFTHSGLDSTATGTVVTVNGTAKLYADLPYSLWVNSGSTIMYSFTDPVISTVSGKRFALVSVTGPSSPFSVTSPVSVIGNYKIQYRVTVDQTGVGNDFAGTVVIIDGTNYNTGGLPVSFWWDKNSNHTFSFGSPLIVNGTSQYAWTSTSGLSSLQSGTLAMTASGNVVGNYVLANRITFDHLGIGPDYAGAALIVDGVPYGVSSLPVSFTWGVGTSHSFAFQSPLIVAANTKQYLWTSTTGLSSLQGGTIVVSTFGSIVGNYKTQYYLTLATVPSGAASPSGAGWYDANTYASVSTPAIVDIVPGNSRYNFSGWTTPDMAEITNPESSTTTVLIDKAKTVTANYAIQYKITFGQSGIGSDFAGTVATIDGADYAVTGLPVSFWWNMATDHTFSFASPLVVNISRQYVWSSTSGLSTLQSGTLTATAYGSVTGNYAVGLKYQVTFGQTGIDDDFLDTVVTVDGVNYKVGELSASFWWESGSVHSFAFQSPLVVVPNTKQYLWISTSGVSALQSGSITVAGSGSVIGNYKTQYYLDVVTEPLGVASPSGTGWYDANTNSTVTTPAFIDIVLGLSRYRFNGWSTEDMSEIADPTRSPTQVFMDKPKIVRANYAVQYFVTFDETGVGSDYSGTIVTVDGTPYTRTGLSVSFWWDNDTVHGFTFESSLLVTANVKQYAWDDTTGLSTERSGFLTVSTSGSIVGNYKTQFYLDVSSAHNSPDPASGWVDEGASVTASVTSPDPGPTGTRYVCVGWTGTGSVTASGSGATVTFTMTQASSITWNWITQYLLNVETNPPGLVVIPGSGWYNTSASVMLTAPSVVNYDFSYWDIDGASQGNGTNPITVQMNAPHVATAHYTPKIQAYSLAITATAGGTTNPSPGTYIYVLNTVVQVYANPSPNYLFDHWVFDGGNVGSANPYSVTMNMNHTLQAVFTAIPPLTLTINPLNSSIYFGQHVTFTSTPGGGTSPYSYQWYLDNNPVSGAVQSSWTFSPAAPGVYYVYLRVTDANNNTVQSATAKITVTSPPPVGGYSVSLQEHASINRAAAYMGIVAMLGFCLVLVKRRRK